MLTCSVYDNAGLAPLVQIKKGTWQARVTIHQAGTYAGGLVHRADGTTIEYLLAWAVPFPSSGVLTIVFREGDESLGAELRQALLDLAA